MLNHRIALFVCAGTSLAGRAIAQDEPAGISTQDAASSGATDVAQEGFQTVVRPEEESVDTTQLSVLAGGLFTSGNSRSLSATAAGDFKYRRNVHQLTAGVAANYGRAAVARDQPVETTVENFQGRVRYDIFLAKAVAAFLQVSARRDRFQGLDLRLNIDPGVAYYFIDQANHQLWGELGYDLQYDDRREDVLLEAETNGILLEETEIRHSGRAFAGYDNKLNAAVTLRTGLEYLQGLAPFEDEATNNVNWRLNWDVGVTSSLGDTLSMATTFTLKYDNNPLPGLSTTDTVTAVNLVYTLL